MKDENIDSHKTINFEKIAKIQSSVEGILIRKPKEIHSEKINQNNNNFLNPRLILENLIQSSKKYNENIKGQIKFNKSRKFLIDYSLNREYLDLNSFTKNNKNKLKNINFTPFQNNDQLLGHKKQRNEIINKNKDNIFNNKIEQINDNIIKIPREDKSNNTTPSSSNGDLDQINHKVNIFYYIFQNLAEIRNLLLEIDNKYITNRNKFQKIYYFTINTKHYSIIVNKITEKIIEIIKDKNNVKNSFTKENEITSNLKDIKRILEGSLDYNKNNMLINE